MAAVSGLSGAGVAGGVAAGVADALTRQAGALEVEYASMTGYKKLVDALLAKLDGSEADDGELAHGTLPRGTLGSGFAEADSLLASIHRRCSGVIFSRVSVPVQGRCL